MTSYKELQETIYSYPTKNPEGFTDSEVLDLSRKFKNINHSKLANSLNGNTCLFIDGEIVTYRHDVLLAICSTIDFIE